MGPVLLSLPQERGIGVQPLRAATGCEVVRTSVRSSKRLSLDRPYQRNAANQPNPKPCAGRSLATARENARALAAPTPTRGDPRLTPKTPCEGAGGLLRYLSCESVDGALPR